MRINTSHTASTVISVHFSRKIYIYINDKKVSLKEKRKSEEFFSNSFRPKSFLVRIHIF